MTIDPITASELAEALREAQKNERTLLSFLYYAKITSNDRTDGGIRRVGEEATQHAAILDRFDAQRRKDIDWQITIYTNHRRQRMANARRIKVKYPNSRELSEEVGRARAANHRILHLRRQLRALGGES